MCSGARYKAPGQRSDKTRGALSPHKDWSTEDGAKLVWAMISYVYFIWVLSGPLRLTEEQHVWHDRAQSLDSDLRRIEP